MSKSIFEKGTYALEQTENNDIVKLKPEVICQIKMNHTIFVDLKLLRQQLIGWETDLNDGVRLNIRPFVEAGVLRSKFNVKMGCR